MLPLTITSSQVFNVVDGSTIRLEKEGELYCTADAIGVLKRSIKRSTRIKK